MFERTGTPGHLHVDLYSYGYELNSSREEIGVILMSHTERCFDGEGIPRL